MAEPTSPLDSAAAVAPAPGRLRLVVVALAARLGNPRAFLRSGLQRGSPRAVVLRWLVLGAALSALVAMGWQPGRRGNLARQARVTMSSNCQIIPEHRREPVDPARLVDGKASEPFDACTAAEAAPWVELDLGKRARLERIVVVGRNDCCWSAGGLPLVLEIADEGQSFEFVRRRTLPFTQAEPWRVRLAGQTARRVRLRVETENEASTTSQRGSSDIVLSEIEVYGQPLAPASP